METEGQFSLKIKKKKELREKLLIDGIVFRTVKLKKTKVLNLIQTLRYVFAFLLRWIKDFYI